MLSKEKIRMAKFVLVGMMNTGVDFAVFVSLVYGLSFSSAWAQLVSYVIGVVNSYVWNRKWTFQASGNGSVTEAVRFVVLTGTSFAAATALLLVLQHGFGWSPILAKAASVFISMVVNYTGSRFWVFRMESRETRTE